MEARINDIYQSTLLLIGKADQGTGFHVDWTEAKNIAFACNQVSVICLGLYTSLMHR